MPWELPEILDPDFAAEGWQKLELMIRLNETIEGIDNDAAKVSALEILWYMRNQLLRDSDWAGMAHSLEIRTPLVDGTLFRKVTRMKASKKDLSGTLSKPLPDAILNRAKTGFYFPVREGYWGRLPKNLKSVVIGDGPVRYTMEFRSGASRDGRFQNSRK